MVRFCCFCNAVNDSGWFCTIDGIDHLPVFLADTETADRTLWCVVVHRNIPVGQENPEVFFLIQCLSESFPQFFRTDFTFVLFQVHKQSIYQWFYNHLTLNESFFWWKFFEFSFLPVDRLDLLYDQEWSGLFLAFFWNHGKCFIKASAGMDLIRELE